ncbi:uncharacterized protein LOC135672070 [Musa acuminata AAA Group]|uniref:uncharacterized protein LOC135672070 n=1 Tax=Musa acuminata AAA Group TaxID=214697 RepID=UPI0031DA7405
MDGLPDLRQITKSADVYATPTQLALLNGLSAGASLRSTAMANPSASSTGGGEDLRLRVEYQWFLMALSVRPERRRAMVAHLLPKRRWARTMASSSSAVKGRCSTRGDSWLHHRRRHDLPDRPGMDRLISDQFLGPCRSTRRNSASSSSALHGPVTRVISLLRPATTEVAAAAVTMFIHRGMFLIASSIYVLVVL